MISPVYTNLNKIDSVLKEEFGYENVTLEHIEKRNNDGTSFDFKFIIEDNQYTMKMVVGGVDALMMDNDLSWSYFEDSRNESSKLIKRSSDLCNLVYDMQEIFDKKMFSVPYLESVMVLIMENVDNDVISQKPLLIKHDNSIEISRKVLTESLSDHDMIIDNIEVSNSDIIHVHFKLESDGCLNISDKFKIESSFIKFGDIDKVWLTENNGVNRMSISFMDNVKIVA